MEQNIYKLELIWPIPFAKLNLILNKTKKIYCVFTENKEYYIKTNSKEIALELEKNKLAILLNN